MSDDNPIDDITPAVEVPDPVDELARQRAADRVARVSGHRVGNQRSFHLVRDDDQEVRSEIGEREGGDNDDS